MNEYPVKILECSYINHDVKRFIVEKPEGYTFIPGQATVVSIDLPEWRNELRPFTFTSLNEWSYLEFTIKIYNDHHGVTEQLGKTNAGATLLLHDIFGTIQYKGPGVFIAAGAGVTPFIAILRDLYNRKIIAGNKLILSNKTSEDIIYGKELFGMLGPDFINVFTREGVIGFSERRIDRNYLVETIRDFSSNFYVCGPDEFVKDMTGYLLSLGTVAGGIIFEQ
ncbi:MAG: flavodoxin reductase [Bacteroidota bacterium]|nr:flavodoxin reductase [Bacteroidota bacterium]